MSRPRTARILTVTALSLGTLALAACGGGSDPMASQPSGGSSQGGQAAPGVVTVGSADFSESQLLAQIYTGALKAKGVQVAQPKLGIGAREAYLKGMTDGSINVVPEYTGAVAMYYDKAFTGSDPKQVYDKAKSVLPAGLTMLEPSQAENKDALAVTRETAQSQGLTKVSDLSGKAKDLTLGAPAEFKARPQGIPGLQKTYGLEFGQFRPLGGQSLIQALVNKQVDVANVFTTDPAYAQHGLVALEDDKGLFGSQNIVPLVTDAVAKDPKAAEALNGVSKALTTEDLQKMLTEVDVNKKDPSAVAQAFLAEKKLG